MEVMDRPLLICLSATRNYGWVTRAFCQANSQWADYIIIIDQMSTDDTRSICAEYEKVIIVNDKNLSYSETRRNLMALDRAREIKGDKIFIYLAIDEVLPANWLTTKEGKRILHSKPSDMFLLGWANLLPDNKHCALVPEPDMYRIFHDDNKTPYDNQGKDMHTHCLPYNIEGEEYIVHDFPILHFGFYNERFNYVKLRYYQMVDYDKTHHSVVTLGRFYYPYSESMQTIGNREINDEWLWEDFDIFSLVDTNTPPFLVAECKKFIEKNGVKHYVKLDIWDDIMLEFLQIPDPRPFWIKMLHGYLHATSKISKNVIVRAIDKILKLFI